MNRFRKENEATTTVQVSEASRPINAAGLEPDKADDVQVETVTMRSTVQAVYQEDEKFEWREVIRGTVSSLLKLTSILTTTSGFKDPQVWMTSLSYLGIIVSLYSFSLFLWVSILYVCEPCTEAYACRPTIVAGLGYSGGQAQLHTGTPTCIASSAPYVMTACSLT